MFNINSSSDITQYIYGICTRPYKVSQSDFYNITVNGCQYTTYSVEDENNKKPSIIHNQKFCSELETMGYFWTKRRFSLSGNILSHGSVHDNPHVNLVRVYESYLPKTAMKDKHRRKATISFAEYIFL
jgi:hypothetical protein